MTQQVEDEGGFNIRSKRDRMIWKITVESTTPSQFLNKMKKLLGKVMGVFSGNDENNNLAPNISFSKSEAGEFRTGLFQLPITVNRPVRNYDYLVNKTSGYEITSKNYSLLHYKTLRDLIDSEFTTSNGQAIPFTIIIFTCRGDSTGLRGIELQNWYYRKYLKYKKKYLQLKTNYLHNPK